MARHRRVRLEAQVHPLRIDPGEHHAAAPAGHAAQPASIAGAEARGPRRIRGRVRMSVQTEAPILSLQSVSKRFGGLTAVDEVSFDVPKGEVFSLIGPNGAGKTTLFNCITGMHVPTAGRVVFEGRDVAGTKPYKTAQKGIARTFQNIRLFEYMSALDNVT